MSAGPRVHAPVVLQGVVSSARICPILPRPTPGMATYRLADIRDTPALCESVTFVNRDHSRGEWPYPSFIERDATRIAANAVIRGRSCELGLALASIADYEGLDLAANIVATGCLKDAFDCAVVAEDGSHAVQPVRHLDAKLDEALDHAGRVGGSWLVLTATHHLVHDPMGRPVSQAVDFERWNCAATATASVSVQFVAVRSLLEAAQHAFGAKRRALRAAPLWALRGQLDQLRLNRGGLKAILEACQRLHEATDNSFEAGGVALVYRYQALIHAAHAVAGLAADGELASWRMAPDMESPAALAARLGAEALTLAQVDHDGDGRSDVPADFRAAGLHYDACRAHSDTDFEWGLRRLDEALRTEGLRKDSHSEYRRILGTRGQLRCRHGLRIAALGWESAAERHVVEARADIQQALEMTPANRAQNDRARVKCYLAHADMALWYVVHDRARRAELEAEIDNLLLGVLGERLYHGRDEGSEPEQYPGWALALLYSWWALRAEWGRVVEHWRACRGPRHQIAGDELGTVPAGSPVEALFRDSQFHACDWVLASLLAEAGARRSHPELFEAAHGLEPVGRGPLSLKELALWSPPVPMRALQGLPTARRASEWAAGVLPLVLPPIALRGEQVDSFVAHRLGVFRKGVGEGRLDGLGGARRDLLLWLGILPRD